jgi:hypothetical protein
LVACVTIAALVGKPGAKSITPERVEELIREQTGISKDAKDFIRKMRQKRLSATKHMGLFQQPRV